MKRAARTLSSLALIGALAGTLGGLIALAIHQLAKTGAKP